MPFSPAQAVKLRKIANISPAIVQRVSIFTGKIYTPLSYAQALEEYYSVRLVDVHVSDIVENLIFSNCYAVNSKAKLICYNGVCEKIREH